jgi:CHAT domain-containing protein
MSLPALSWINLPYKATIYLLILITGPVFGSPCAEEADKYYAEGEHFFAVGDYEAAGRNFLSSAKAETACPGWLFADLQPELNNAGVCFQMAGNHAMQAYASRWMLKAATDSAEHYAAAEARLLLAAALLALGRNDSAAALSRKAIEFFYADTSRHYYLASAGVIFAEAASASGSKELAARTAKELIARSGPSGWMLANTVGNIYASMPAPDSACSAFAAGWHILQLQDETQRTAEAALSAGYSCKQAGLSDTSAFFFKQAHRLLLISGDNHGAAIALAEAAMQYRSLPELEAASALAAKAGSTHGQALAASYAGRLLEQQAEYSSAGKQYQKAMAMYYDAGAGSMAEQQLANIAKVYMRLGYYDSASVAYSSYLASLGGADYKGKAGALMGQASVFAAWGHTGRAFAIYRQALDYAAKASDRLLEANCRSNIASLLHSYGEHGKALAEYQAALDIFSAARDITSAAYTRANIAAVMFELGQNNIADQAFSNSLQTAYALNDFPLQASCYDYLGLIAQQNRQYFGAETSFSKAIKIRKMLGAKDALAHSLNNKAVLFLETGRNAEAAELLQESVGHLESLRRGGLAGKEFFASQIFCYHNLVLSKLRLGNMAEAFYYNELSKSRSLLDAIAGTQQQPVSLAGAQQELTSDEICLIIGTSDIHDITVMAVAKDWQAYKLVSKDSLIKDLLAFSSIRSAAAEMLDIAEIAVLRQFLNGGQAALPSKLGQKVFSAAVLGYAKLVTMHNYRNTAEARAAGRCFYEHLIGPFSQRLENSSSISLVADGALTGVPFETFIGNTGRYLIESHSIRYTQSLTISSLLAGRQYSSSRIDFCGFYVSDYSALRDAPPGQPITGFSLAMASEQFAYGADLTSLYVSAGLADMPDLELGRSESAYLAGIFSGSNISYADSKASEAAVKYMSASGQLKTCKRLHFSAHGISVSQAPLLSALALHPGNGEDGFLASGEIASLDINADIVTLSACNTAAGSLFSGEGISSIAHSFFQAGAKSVLAALWEVDEAATAEFMQRFYSYSLQYGCYSAGLQAAKNDFIAGRLGYAWSLPYFWAGFVLFGR